MNVSQDRKDRIIEAVKALNFKCEEHYVYRFDNKYYKCQEQLPSIMKRFGWKFICTKEEFNKVAAEMLTPQSYEPSTLEDCEYTLGESDVWFGCKVVDKGVRGWTILCPHLVSDCDTGLQFVLKDEVKFRPTKDVQNKLDILAKECNLSPQQAKTILDKLENI